MDLWIYIYDWRFFCTMVLIASLASLVLNLRNISMRDNQLPPGPPTIPIVGNLHIMPKTLLHLKLTQWSKVYGDIFSLKLGPHTAVVLTSPRLVRELMDKRSASSSDRAPNFLADATVEGKSLALARYGKNWRTLRRAAHELLTRNACERHLPIQEAESTQLMYEFLTRPQSFYDDIKRYSTSVIMTILWGVRCPEYDSPLMTDFYDTLEMWKKVMEPGSHPPLDLLPILKHVPEKWAPWKPLVRQVRYLQRKLYFGLLNQAENRILKDRRNGSYMEALLDRHEQLGLDRELTAYLAAALLEGGSETQTLYFQSLILALVAFPRVQKRAQEEIDRVVGSGRVPTLDDLKDLPYIQAIVKETHRFRPVAPLGLPHALSSEESIDGYILPKGASIIMNIWGMFHDEEAFDKPEAFNPDRFLDSEFGTKAHVDTTGRRHDYVFGTGRRICPGIHLAQNSIFIITMKLLWGFNFAEAVDKSTNVPIKVDIHDYLNGLLLGPSPFQCRIEVRSAKHAELIESEFSRAKPTFVPYEPECL
ncbi:cytochrome P450 [Gautieria morchelliformis]|nr:cytochrome P450 [Gautieria morchelliformis]